MNISRRLTVFLLTITCFIILAACTYSHYRVTPLSAGGVDNVQLARFLKAYALIKTYYVKPVPDKTLITNAINGMLEGLDRYSGYLDANDMTYLKQLTTGNYAGIGIEVMPEDDALKVITPLDNSPASKAGILPRDKIIAVNQKPVAGMSFREAMETLRGPPGSTVDLTLVRESLPKPFDLQLVRVSLKSESVKYRLLPHHAGYIRVGLFQSTTLLEVKQAVAILRAQNHDKLSGLILDLRNNPGGLLDAAAAVTNLFLEKNSLSGNRLIVYSKNRQGETIFEAKAEGGDILNGAPLVILINQGSASGAEIVAGALHDYHRALLVGEKTFGKGSVQTVIPLDKTDAIKITTALYYTPSGHLINNIGISPDIRVKSNTSNSQIMLEPATDNVLARGVNALRHTPHG